MRAVKLRGHSARNKAAPGRRRQRWLLEVEGNTAAVTNSLPHFSYYVGQISVAITNT